MIEISIKTVKLSQIKLNKENPRRISKQHMDRLVKSLTEFPDMMQIREVVVDETMTCIGGNMRVLALRKAGAKEATAKIVKGLTEEQKRRFVISDNSSWGTWDFDALANGWSDLPLAEWGIDLPEDWLKQDADPTDAEPQIDRAEELNKKWKCAPGDLWQIGNHRLLCGDSTKAEDVVRVMGGEKADACISDPPYGIGFDTDYTRFTAPKSQQFAGVNKKHAPVHGDDSPFDPAVWLAFDSVVLWGANYYAEKLPIGTWLVWDKRFDNGKAWLSDAELAWMKGGQGVYIFSLTSQGMIRPEPVQHPTQKAVALMVWCIEKSKAGGIIIDPFLGSGSTMVACQNLNRKCRGIEISPAYCAVILQRMFDAFGITGERMA